MKSRDEKRDRDITENKRMEDSGLLVMKVEQLRPHLLYSESSKKRPNWRRRGNNALNQREREKRDRTYIERQHGGKCERKMKSCPKRCEKRLEKVMER